MSALGNAPALSGTYRKTRLDNGLRVITEAVPFVRSISLGIWVQTGSRDETGQNRGISHFLEHMLFKGTQVRNAFDIAHSLESLGGNLDAFTSRDVTCLYARCLDEHIDKAIDVLADMIQNSVFDEAEIEKEKRVVLEEIQTVEDTPDDLIHDLFAQSVWGEHPVGAPILGRPETVHNLTRERVVDFLHAHYHPDRMIISAAGHLEHAHIVEMASKLFNFAPADRCDLQRVSPTPAERSQRHFQRDIGQTHICLGATAFAYNHPRRYDQLVANTALGEGMSSRLFQRIREQLGLAYAVYSYVEMLEDTGLFGTYMACESGRTDAAVEIALCELDTLRREGISSRELASAKAQLRGELILGQESMDKRMGRLANREIYTGAYLPAEDALLRIDAVTEASVLAACDGFLNRELMHRVTVGP